jgi:hypothetical protein
MIPLLHLDERIIDRLPRLEAVVVPLPVDLPPLYRARDYSRQIARSTLRIECVRELDLNGIASEEFGKRITDNPLLEGGEITFDKGEMIVIGIHGLQ